MDMVEEEPSRRSMMKPHCKSGDACKGIACNHCWSFKLPKRMRSSNDPTVSANKGKSLNSVIEDSSEAAMEIDEAADNSNNTTTAAHVIPPSPPTRYEFADDAPSQQMKSGPSLSTLRVKSLLKGDRSRSDIPNVPRSPSTKGIIISETAVRHETSSDGCTKDTNSLTASTRSKERSSSSVKSFISNQALPYLPVGDPRHVESSIPLTRDRELSQSEAGSWADFKTNFPMNTNQSVVSDLSDSMKPRKVSSLLPTFTTASSRPINVGNCTNGGCTFKTETSFVSFIGSVYESICTYCGSIDGIDGAGGFTQRGTTTKDERKEEAEETFMGKIISCPRMMDCGALGGCGVMEGLDGDIEDLDESIDDNLVIG